MNSREFIIAFDRLDRKSVQDPDLPAEEQEAIRRRQVIRITRQVLGDNFTRYTDDQIHRLWRDFSRGLF